MIHDGKGLAMSLISVWVRNVILKATIGKIYVVKDVVKAPNTLLIAA